MTLHTSQLFLTTNTLNVILCSKRTGNRKCQTFV